MTTRPLRLLPLLAALLIVLAAHSATASAAGWAPATRLAEGAATRHGGTELLPDGTVIVAFGRQEPLAGHVEVAIKPPFGTFGAPQRLSTTSTASSPQTASDAAGNVTLIWLETIAGTRAVRGTTRPVGGTFGPVQTISDTGTNANFPRLDAAGGRTVVAWSQGGRVRAATARAGEPFAVHNPLSANIGFDDAPLVGAAPDGAALVAWHTTKPGLVTTLHAAARTAGGEFASLEDVAQYPSFRGSQQLALSPEGRATLAWSYWDDAADRYVVQAAARGRTGEFGGVETVGTIQPGGGGHIALDVGGEGTATLLWTDSAARYATRPEGGGFGAPQAIAGSTSGGYVPELRSAPDGTARAIWRGQSGGMRVETARIRPDGTSDSAETLAAATGQSGTSSYFDGRYGVAVDARGNAAVGWYHGADVAPGPATDLRQAIEVRILDGTPPSLRAVSVPPAALTGVPVPMTAVAADALTPVTIRWTLGKFLSAQGPAVAPTFDLPGDRLVDVQAVDAAGNVTQTTRSIRVTQNPEPPCPEGQV